MCGICGQVRFDNESASPAVVAAMMERMRSRGPDTDGMLHHGRVTLGHRRLKIIDLSEKARQPLSDPHLGLSIVFNGCIYNYPDLRQELESEGYRFFSTGDTEVILKAYHAWGPQCVERFNGMFALAIHERESGTLFFARDRLGIKPLYYAELPGELRFASSLSALLAGGGLDTSIDPEALHHYLSFHSVVPAPMTILRGVRKLPPATTLTLRPDGRRETREYWQLRMGRDGADDRTEEEWKDELLDVLGRAVRRRMIADVPVGVLLSGGVDSSLVVGLLRQQGQDRLETFSIGFHCVGGREGNEFRYSDVIAERFETEHHRIFVESDDALPSLVHCVRAMSEPMVSHDAIGFYLLSREVSKYVKVVQSGQGADEIFGGYHWYPPLRDSDEPVTDYASVFFDRDHDEMAEVLRPSWVSRDVSRDYVASSFERPGAGTALEKALRLDTTVMLVDDPVKRVDNMTMGWGLEARVPFLDHEVVEFAAAVPTGLKVRDTGDEGKYILKEAARRVLPVDVIDRPKGYFPVPALERLQGEYLDFVREVLDRPKARDRGIFREEYLKRLFENPEGEMTPLRGSKLWQVALLELWLQEHGV